MALLPGVVRFCADLIALQLGLESHGVCFCEAGTKGRPGHLVLVFLGTPKARRRHDQAKEGGSVVQIWTYWRYICSFIGGNAPSAYEHRGLIHILSERAQNRPSERNL
jgi:hypothetical protein